MQPAQAGSPKQSRTASSVHDVSVEKPPFGSRFLTDDADVWSQNAWDHVPPPEDQEDKIAAAIARQKNAPVPEDERQKYNEKPAKHWDNFYKMNADNFFRNRKWLHLEFPELVKAAESETGPLTIAEIGCGAGNAVFPLLSANNNPQLSLHAYDYSSHAVKLVQHNPLYTSPPCGFIQAAVWDLTSSEFPAGIQPNSVDIIVLVFVLSALHPREWRNAVANIHKMLKPGGLLLFRDYGRHDLTQLRFKSGRLLEDNLYIRGDKTRVYFFEIDELSLIFTGAPAPIASKRDTGVKVVEETGDSAAPESSASSPLHTPAYDPSPAGTFPSDSTSMEIPISNIVSETSSPVPHAPFTALDIHPSLLETPTSDHHPLFAIEQLGVDRRLLVNRKRQLKMYRVWMQGKFRKLVSTPTSSN
ncbi:methyltransferase [Wolfiporia cocos MD-104 SS10]|uniref:tRNA N(3)-methylcytidine methyltransferase n=1 Tax=Wolfiporia cocos (strain MD-104) TaxID=742152 RepID=A0A2H3JQW9_WOLCO|nr:methyltransferase [Wolfiporia cocos MD-104 SS10]